MAHIAMLRQCLKLFSLLFIIWIAILIIISKTFIVTLLEEESEKKQVHIYKEALRKITKHHTKEAKADVWDLVGLPNLQLSIKDRLSVIKNKEFPLGKLVKLHKNRLTTFKIKIFFKFPSFATPITGTGMQISLKHVLREESSIFILKYGKLGKPVYMLDDSKIKGVIRMQIAKGWQDNSFNQFVSDLIPFDRSLPDFRNKWCLQIDSEESVLPEASVVICFHNEAWSTLLRTIHSVLNRSPEHLLREIILVDDFSNLNHLKMPLEEYIKRIPKINMLRTDRREGLIRARIMGVKTVVTPIVIFLDSHCECTDGWLEALLERVAKNPKTVASPVIDHIDTFTFEYVAQDPKNIRIGGFNWYLKFIWRSLDRVKERENLFAPINTPTIAGGLFAINIEFFKHIGYYDEGFDIWGGENLELSFKVWMCGGSLEIVPCSHVGHIFRENFPYGTKGSFKRNSVRLAEVWMDRYAKLYYQRIGYYKGDFGNVTSRKELRKDLKCKSFDWYLSNVYPEMKDSLTNAASGQIFKTGNYTLCLDGGSDYVGGVSVLPCHRLGGNQFWVYTKNGKIQSENLCLDFLLSMVILDTCRDHASQVWLYYGKTQHIQNKHTNLCLTLQNNGQITQEACKEASTQQWNMENFHVGNLSEDLQNCILRREC